MQVRYGLPSESKAVAFALYASYFATVKQLWCDGCSVTLDVERDTLPLLDECVGELIAGDETFVQHMISNNLRMLAH